MTRQSRSIHQQMGIAFAGYGLLLSSLIFLVSIVGIAALMTGLPSR